MSEEDICKVLDEYEKAYLMHLIRTWRLDPERFREVVDDVEAFIDLKNKICPSRKTGKPKP